MESVNVLQWQVLRKCFTQINISSGDKIVEIVFSLNSCVYETCSQLVG